MSLSTYRTKRRFDRTPEPAGETNSGKGPLRFVVQKHHATRLHYDFRLEADGALKSWAVPKGPSLNPADKRLAIQVEDHPLDYRTFEGVIPPGNYGAGEVIVWDEGTYEVPGARGREESDAAVLRGLAQGRLAIVLHGKKLHGEFALTRFRSGEKNSWLLIKKRDEFASTDDVTADDRSVRSKRRLAAPKKSEHSGEKGKVPARRQKESLSRKATLETATLTNLQKVYWPADGTTKGDLLAYYQTVAPVLLPHLHDRPESLNRHPNGIDGKSFFQKDVGRNPPPNWVPTARVPSESRGEEITYIVCQDEATLLYLVNLGCIELNPLLSRLGSLDRPDFLVIDLDPEDLPMDRAVEVALAVRKLLDQADAPSSCKTSGKRGLHVCVPLSAAYDYDLARQFAELVARLVHDRLPDSTSVLRSPELRRQQVYLDFLQNRRGQTLAAPYSARPWPGATVSTPLKWSEVRRGLDPSRFTIRTMPRRVDRVGDLWAPILGPGVDLVTSLAKLERIVGKLRTKK